MKLRQSHLILTTLLLLLIVLSGFLSGCASQPAHNSSSFPMADIEQMPMEVQQSPSVVRESYQFAFANPEILKQLPCYCGCGDMGHTSNYACYFRETNDSGEITYDNHALGCSICVDITLDAMRLLKDGKTLPEIRAYVDETYSQYGPSNMPPNE